MSRQKFQFQADAICKFFQDKNYDKKLTLQHFKEQNIPARTIHKVIKRYVETGTSEYKQIPGRKPTVNTTSLQKRVLNKIKRNPSVSQRKLAVDLGTNQTAILRAEKKLGVKSKKKRKAPLYKEQQLPRIKIGAKKLYRKHLPSGGGHFFVMDDETYVPADSSQIPGTEYYKEVPGVQLNPEVMVARKEKFTKKFMVWQAISEDGDVSEPFITTGTINGDIYLDECINKRLVPFYEKKKGSSPIIFWFDGATAHYKGTVLARLRELNIDFVSKEDNPPNLPQCRPIERFWALCKAEYKLTKKKCDTLRKFKNTWTRVSTKVAAESGKSLFAQFRKKLRRVAIDGPYSVK